MKQIDVAALFPQNSIVVFDYVGGSGSSKPGVKSTRTLIVSDSDKSTLKGLDLSHNAGYRVFKRSRISNIKILGALVSAEKVAEKIFMKQPHLKDSI